MAFLKRTAAPDPYDMRFISKKQGGLSPCLLRNAATGSVLPNCVGYAYGRFMEILGAESCSLSTGNAENWYGFLSDGYERGSEPKVGAIACWRKGEAYDPSDGAGHVAVVEEVLENGDILCSNSDYYGRSFYTCTYKKASGYSLGAAYRFQGFIYCPFEEAQLPMPEQRDESRLQLEIMADGLRVRKRPELSAAVILGTAKKGVYPVLESRDMTHEASNGYLWHRIGDAACVASKEGQWTRLLQPEEDEIMRLRRIIEGAMELLKQA